MSDFDPQPPTRERPWLLWDGACAFCRACIEWLERRDPGGRLQALAWQECPRPPMDERLERHCRRSVVLLEGGRGYLTGGRAVLAVLERIGWRPRLVGLASRPPLLWAVEAGYRVIASQRGWLGRWLPPRIRGKHAGRRS